MRSFDKLKVSMKPGHVYRRQELEAFSTAVDRDLKNLVQRGEVKKLAGGLYYRPRKNAFGAAPPDDKALVRAFLKTDDFILSSYNYFNQLGLGLTQVHNASVVYNHRRTGDHVLGGKRFTFRLVPAYPHALSKEFLLVDMLNNLKRLPDDTVAVLANLKARAGEFDRDKVRACAERYGTPGAKKAVQAAYA